MPFEWKITKTGGEPLAELHAWPYRSLPKRGFAAFMGASFLLLALPLFGLVGTDALWFVLIPILCTFGGVWWALQHSYRAGETIEVLRISPTKTELFHHRANKPTLRWEANTHWVRASVIKEHEIETYLTLSGGSRTVSLGSFLTPQERSQLYSDLTYYLGDAA